ERVVVEMVLGGPQAIEPEVGGEPSQPDLFLPHACIGAVIPAVAGEDHHHPDIHWHAPFLGVGGWSPSDLTGKCRASTDRKVSRVSNRDPRRESLRQFIP